MNERTYCSGVTNLYTQGFFDQPQIGDSVVLEVEDDTEPINMTKTEPVNILTVNPGASEDENEMTEEVRQTQTDHVSYTEVQQTLTEIVRFVVNDKTELANLYAFGQEVLSAYRDGLDVTLECHTSGTRNNERTGIICPVVDGRQRNRLKSAIERRKPHGRKRACEATSQEHQEDQVLHDQILEKETQANAARKGKRACQLCRSTGHHGFSCPTITRYGVSLQRNDRGS